MAPDAAVRIAWNEGTMGDWVALVARIPRTTLPQSFAYAQAMARTHGHVPRLGVIQQGDTPIGVVQMLERRTFKIIVQRDIHRGPLWLDGRVPDPPVLEEVFRRLRRACPSHPLSRVSLLPELDAGPGVEAMMARCGFHRVGPGYRTVWLDLARGETELQDGLARDWRKRLRRAERAALTVDIDWEAKNLPWLMKQEHDQAVTKGFRPMTGALAVRLRNALLKGGGKDDGVLMVAALEGDGSAFRPVACLLFLRHGNTATSQIGWANAAGRDSGAMRLVTWRAALALKERGVRWLDLGGINPDSAPGVTEFKLGTGGQATETVGLYR